MQINSYFVDQKGNLIRVLIEVKDTAGRSLSTLYYELTLKDCSKSENEPDYELESINEIFNILRYLYINFKGDIKKAQLAPDINKYIIKVLNFQTHKKGFNERLIRKLRNYYNNAILPEEESAPVPR